MAALPALRQSAPASAVTLGRLSKITPMTPSGVATRSICRPFGPLEARQHAADRIGQVGNALDGRRNGFEALRVQSRGGR